MLLHEWHKGIISGAMENVKKKKYVLIFYHKESGNTRNKIMMNINAKVLYY